jgi:hypothetical protein
MIFYWIEESGIHQRGAFLKIPTAAGRGVLRQVTISRTCCYCFPFSRSTVKKKKKGITHGERERGILYTFTVYM